MSELVQDRDQLESQKPRGSFDSSLKNESNVMIVHIWDETMTR